MSSSHVSRAVLEGTMDCESIAEGGDGEGGSVSRARI